MPCNPSEEGSAADLACAAGRGWLGKSVWRVADAEISKIKSWPSITVANCYRGDGEAVWRGDRHRLVLISDQYPPALVQVEQGPTWQTPLVAPGTLAFYPPGLTLRIVQSAARFVSVLWDTDLYSALLPELGAAASRFEFLYPLEDPLLGQIVTSLAQEIKGGPADRILIESLVTALCVRIARRFVGHLPLPTNNRG